METNQQQIRCDGESQQTFVLLEPTTEGNVDILLRILLDIAERLACQAIVPVPEAA
jgi:hypothetical protein